MSLFSLALSGSRQPQAHSKSEAEALPQHSHPMRDRDLRVNRDGLFGVLLRRFFKYFIELRRQAALLQLFRKIGLGHRVNRYP